MEYISNHLLDITQIWTKMEDNLKIFKVEFLSNHLLDHIQILSFSLNDQITFLQIFKMKTTFNGRGPPMEDNLKY